MKQSTKDKLYYGSLIFMVIMMITTIVASCTYNAVAKKNIPNNTLDYINLVEVAENGDVTILVDKNTRVLYYRNRYQIADGRRSEITVIYNADGTPKLYEGELK